MGIFWIDPRLSSSVIQLPYHGVLFTSLLMVASFGLALEFVLVATLAPWMSETGQVFRALLLSFEVALIPIGMMICYPLCWLLLRISAKMGFWGYGAAVFVGLSISVVAATLVGLLSEASEAVSIGLHWAVGYGIPAAVLVLFRLSEREDSVWEAVFGTHPKTPILLAALPILAIPMWHLISIWLNS